jgi:hypothetical protein
MPAIESSFLHAKVNLLLKLVDSPAQLMQELTQFYEAYADLTFQAGLFSVKAGDLPAYHNPALMNRELETAFVKVSAQEPQKALVIIDLLAGKHQLEPRQLACAMLGNLPEDNFPQVAERLAAWAHAVEEPEDLVWMFKRGTALMRQQAPEQWLDLLQTWLESDDPVNHRVAVYGLTSMINDASLTSLPLIYKHLKPLMLECNSKTVPQLETILERLVEKSENETIFFIKQVLTQSRNPILTRLVRRSLPLFSTAAQESLRNHLRTL